MHKRLISVLAVCVVSLGLLQTGAESAPDAGIRIGSQPGSSVKRSAGKGLFAGQKAIAGIVTEPDAPKDVTKAADELSAYLERMAGVKLKRIVFTDDMLNRKGLIFLGKAATGAFTEKELADVGYEGSRIRTKNGSVHIVGGKYWGTYYGACHFLARLGARFYAKDHEVIPATARLRIVELDVLHKPVFEFRNIKFTDMKLGQHLQVHNAMRPIDADPKVGYVHWLHNSSYLVPYYKYAKTHPEYYAKQYRDTLDTDYVKAISKGNKLHLCLSNPEVRKIAKERLLLAIEQQQDRRFFAVTQADSWAWCSCDACKAMDPVQGGPKTDRYLTFVNEVARAVAEKYPDVILLAAAYGGYGNGTATPPVKVKPEPNVRIILAPYTPEVQDKGHWFDHKLNAQFKPWYDGWVKLLPTGQLFIFDYPYANFRGLSFFHELSFEGLKRYAKDGVRGIYFDSHEVFMDSLFCYVISRLAWEPSLDTRPLVEDFIATYYGDAGPTVQKIYDRLHKITYPYERSQGPTINMTKLLTNEEIDELLGLYAEAEGAVKNSPAHLARVKRDKSCLLYTDISKRNPGNGKVKNLDRFKQKLAEFIRITATIPSRSRFKSNLHKQPESVKAWFWKVARLKLTGKKIMDDPLVRRLLADPRSVHIPPYERPKVRLLPNARGWRIPLELSEGALEIGRYKYECPERKNVRGLRTSATEYNLMRVRFVLPENPGKAVLALEGQDDDKPGTTDVRIELNGKQLFVGENKFVEKGWSTWKLPVQEGLLKEGENELVIEDTQEGINIFAEWVIISDIKIETERKVKAPPAKTLFLAHFDDAVKADSAANTEAQVRGDVRISPQGKWGGALDMGYSEKSTGAVSFNASGNFDQDKGTLEMWVKLGWDPNEDTQTRTFVRIKSGHNAHNGLLLFRYGPRRTGLAWMSYGPAGTTSADISGWKRDTWHHLAVTWDKDADVKQIFLDGVFVSKDKMDDIPAPDVIYVGCVTARASKARLAGALIDELRITDGVLWKGRKKGEKVFDPPGKPYAAPSTSGK